MSLINYNWMPCVANWAIDNSSDFYLSAGVSKVCEPKELNESNAHEVEDNHIVFVKTDYLKNGFFQSKILPLIKKKFTLVSGISSYTVDQYASILENEYVNAWYCTNPPIRHEKVIGIPIGFEERERDGGNQQVLQKFYNLNVEVKINKILLPYHTVSTNPSRQNALNYLKSLPFVDVQTDKLSFEDYLELLSRYKYCICLEGAGWDTHRNYECLLTGTVPIMKQSNVSLIYEDWDLPCEFIENWTGVNEDYFNMLNQKAFEFSSVKKFLQTSNHVKRIRPKEWSKEKVFYDLKYDNISSSCPHHNSFVDFVESENFSSVVDIGCGNGRLCSMLDKDIRYIGLDLNENCIETAKKNFKENAEFHLFDIEIDDLSDLNLPNRENTIVYIDSVITMLYDPENTLRKLFPLCRCIFLNRTPLSSEVSVRGYKWGGMDENSPLWKFTLKYFEDIVPDNWQVKTRDKQIILKETT